ncbi:hypothetical protein B0T09DRAFT_331938 [Sordaria sp. MPI-SDFR-AT-0083]|nr:hypothetical protein B0T09DRAFT_331938 [Sordaria sp. MPI-SDFR-AT-0083]
MHSHGALGGDWAIRFEEAPRNIQRGEFDWRILFYNDDCQSDNDATDLRVKRRRTRTMELVNTLKRDLFLWAGFTTACHRPGPVRAPMNKLMEDLLYCILRETPRVQRLLL